MARASVRWASGPVAVTILAGCGLSPSPTAVVDGKVEVVAAENCWGSIARQIGGEHAQVLSVIVNPQTDPHDYEATPRDARAIAQARYVIVNGAGYDPWVSRLLDADPVSGRKVLTIGDLFDKKQGDNPHLWYSPAYVDQVVDRIAADLASLDSADAGYFLQQATQYRTVGLKAYHSTLDAIKEKYAGTKVGATESIFSYLAADAGLNLITPYSFLKAISEGADPSAADKAAVQSQIANGQIKIFVYNSQNASPDVQVLVNQARSKAIPVVTITETLVPATATFQDWQTGQLQRLLVALGG